jgi:hypothetical protein
MVPTLKKWEATCCDAILHGFLRLKCHCGNGCQMPLIDLLLLPAVEMSIQAYDAGWLVCLAVASCWNVRSGRGRWLTFLPRQEGLVLPRRAGKLNWVKTLMEAVGLKPCSHRTFPLRLAHARNEPRHYPSCLVYAVVLIWAPVWADWADDRSKYWAGLTVCRPASAWAVCYGRINWHFFWNAIPTESSRSKKKY